MVKLSVLVTVIAITVVTVGVIAFVETNSGISVIGGPTHKNDISVTAYTVNHEDWKKYINTRYGFSIDFLPLDTVVKKESSSGTVFTTSFTAPGYDGVISVALKNGYTPESMSQADANYLQPGEKILQYPVKIAYSHVTGYYYTTIDSTNNVFTKTLYLEHNNKIYVFSLHTTSSSSSSDNLKQIEDALDSIEFTT